MFRKAKEFLSDALSKVTGDRARQHGALANYQNVAVLWTAYLEARFGDLGVSFRASDVTTMMQLLKIGRMQSGEYNQDDDIDNIGYGGCTAELRAMENLP